MHINQFLDWLLKEKRYSEHTVKAYETDLIQFEEFLKSTYDAGLTNANSAMLRSWVVALMESGINTKSVNRKISSLKSLYNFLHRKNVIEVLPTSKLVSPKVKKPLPSFIKNAEMEALFENFEFSDDYAGKRDELIMEILYSCGIRLSELIGIMEGNVNLHDASLKVLGKRNKERIVPLHVELIKKLKAYRNIKEKTFDSPYLLLTDKGQKMYPKFVYRKVNYYLGQVTTSKKKSPHILRHTFATHMLNNGADLNTIKELLGHTNLSATEVYTHNSIEKLKNIYKQAHPRA